MRQAVYSVGQIIVTLLWAIYAGLAPLLFIVVLLTVTGLK